MNLQTIKVLTSKYFTHCPPTETSSHTTLSPRRRERLNNKCRMAWNCLSKSL